MEKVLITGATGFIGQQCLPLLEQSDFEIHAITSGNSNPSNAPRFSCVWHNVNLLDDSQIAGVIKEVQPSYLLHLAWYSEPGLYWDAIENFHWLKASLSLVQEFVQHGGKRCVVAGSCAEYDWDHGFCSELVTPCRPATLYGTCKNSLHTLLEAFSRKTGLSTAWARIFFMYGPNEHPARLVSSVIRSLLKNEVAKCSHGEQIRDYLHVHDVARALVEVLFSDVQGPINIASGEPVALKELVHNVGHIIGNDSLIRLGEIPASPGEPPLITADVRRLTEEIGWQPKFNLHSGLEHTVNWWKNNEKEGGHGNC